MSLNYTIFWHAQNQKNTIISNIESFHFFLSMFWFKILNFDSFHCFFSVFWFIISDFDTFLCFLTPFWVKLDSFWLCFNRKSVIFLNYDNRVGESNKTFVLSHHLSRIMYYPEKQVFTIENQVKFGIIFL